MSNQDIATTVNAFMLNSAPTLAEPSPMAYDLLKSLSRILIFKIKTTDQHAEFVMGRKYGHLYATQVIRDIIQEAHGDEFNERIMASKKRRACRMSSIQQPALLAI